MLWVSLLIRPLPSSRPDSCPGSKPGVTYFDAAHASHVTKTTSAAMPWTE